MFGYIDERLYGKVDRIPGVGYVVTLFTHWCFLPVMPHHSVFVFEADRGFGRTSETLPLSPRSVASGYARTWCLFLVFLFSFIGMGNLQTFLTTHNIGPKAVQVAFTAATFAIMLAVVVPAWLSVALQAFVHAASVVAWGLWADAGAPVGAGGRPGLFGVTADLAIANAALFVHNLTYFWNRASAARAAALMERHADLLGLPEPPRAQPADSPPIVMPVSRPGSPKPSPRSKRPWLPKPPPRDDF